MEKLLIKIDKNLKEEFQKVCSQSGCSMTEATIGLIKQFITQSTTKK